MEADHVMDNLDFSEEEIKEQLALLGYQNIPKHRLLEFKRDLDDLIRHGRWENLAPRTQSVTSQPAPPAYIREKVNPFDGSGKGFILHAEKTNPHRKQLTTCEDRSCGWRWGCCHSYAHHSVAPKLQLPPSAWNRLQGAPDVENTLESLLSDSLSSSSERQLRRFIKRKVLRKHEGKSLICDESDYSEGSDAVSLLEEQTAELDLSTSAQDVEGEGEGGSPPQISESDDFSLSTVEPYIRVMTRSQSDGDVRPKPKSFIRPVMSQQNIKKTDPVTKYHQYKKIWGTFNLPGETDRNALHMEIKEKLAYQPPPPKPRRVLEPNSYVVPTEKKRLALRWEIRNYLANGLLPPRFHDQL
uniref:Hydrolethalus syndrome 1 n=3 Tax=Nothobranchius korthausae TaxID=1143690 RepID=A0A1A8G1J0_9TELE